MTEEEKDVVMTKDRTKEAQEKRGYMNLKSAARYLGIPYDTLSKKWPEWFDKAGIAVSRIGRRLTVKISDLDRMVEAFRIN